jgi:hypothetical protein
MLRDEFGFGVFGAFDQGYLESWKTKKSGTMGLDSGIPVGDNSMRVHRGRGHGKPPAGFHGVEVKGGQAKHGAGKLCSGLEAASGERRADILPSRHFPRVIASVSP